MATAPAEVERVRQLVAETLNLTPPEPSTDLIESGLLDSLALVELLHALETELGVEVPLDALEIESFRTVETIAELVAGLRSAA